MAKKPPKDDPYIVYDQDLLASPNSELAYEAFADEGWDDRPYRNAAERKKFVAKEARAYAGIADHVIKPVTTNARRISRTFWGQAWCKNLEGHHDFESRLPKGRGYLKDGGVIDLQIREGLISAKVVGTRLYEVEIKFAPLSQERRTLIINRCAGSIGSITSLLSGLLSEEIIEILCDEHQGIFPDPSEITMSCTCPDWAHMCKHVAASLYGVGALLDSEAELFFTLRGMHPNLLVKATSKSLSKSLSTELDSFDQSDLAELFGVDIDLS